ncbi:MAG: hypothetical protein NVSMB65_07210 [Chloroflexota bacterium]
MTAETQQKRFTDFFAAVGPEIILARVRQRAIIELLVEKGIITSDEFNARYDQVLSRGYLEITELIFGKEAADQARNERFLSDLQER